MLSTIALYVLATLPVTTLTAPLDERSLSLGSYIMKANDKPSSVTSYIDDAAHMQAKYSKQKSCPTTKTLTGKGNSHALSLSLLNSKLTGLRKRNSKLSDPETAYSELHPLAAIGF